jgi:hypothetical protein
LRAAVAVATAIGAIGAAVALAPAGADARRSATTTRHLAATQAVGPRGTAAARHHPKRAPRNSTPALKLIWGPVNLPSGQSAFPIYHQLGVQVFQVDLNWAQTAPSRPANPQDPNDPAYQWPANLSEAIRQAAQDRIQICLLVQATPPWANGNRSTAWAPNDPTDYANFLVAAAHRYPTVRLWMIWGEPNRQGEPNFEPMPPNSPVGPRRYAILLNAGYHALKSVSATNTVIGGNTWSFGSVEPADFVKWMRLPNGKPPPLDYYGHNAFGRRAPDLSENPYFRGGRDINDIDTLEAQLNRIYHRPVKLWLSEFTISSDHNNRAFDFHVSRAEQAKWLTAAYKLVDSVNYVAGLGWFGLLDEPPTVAGHLTTGLMTWDGRPKPAFAAYEHVR